MNRAATRAMMLLCVALAGCAAQEHIPHYPSMPPQQSLAVLRNRAASIHDVAAQGLMTLTRPDGDTVRLDVALALQPPNRARLRAWKFGQAVFDLTVTRAGVWAVEPSPTAGAGPAPQFDPQAAAATRRWLALLSGAFDQPATSVRIQSSNLIINEPTDAGQSLDCVVDRSTLTPRRYTVAIASGGSPFTLTLDHYALFNGIAWPQRIVAASRSGQVRVELHDVQINAGVAPAAFRPPHRAIKMLGPAIFREPAR